jgi:hypothetical protein
VNLSNTQERCKRKSWRYSRRVDWRVSTSTQLILLALRDDIVDRHPVHEKVDVVCIHSECRDLCIVLLFDHGVDVSCSCCDSKKPAHVAQESRNNVDMCRSCERSLINYRWADFSARLINWDSEYGLCVNPNEGLHCSATSIRNDLVAIKDVETKGVSAKISPVKHFCAGMICTEFRPRDLNPALFVSCRPTRSIFVQVNPQGSPST